MGRMVKCVKLGREAEGMDFPPVPGELGKRIFDNVSKEAWQAWLRTHRPPTLVVWGTDDAVIPPPEPDALAREGVAFHLLQGRGHMAQVEAADEVNRLIEALLRD